MGKACVAGTAAGGGNDTFLALRDVKLSIRVPLDEFGQGSGSVARTGKQLGLSDEYRPIAIVVEKIEATYQAKWRENVNPHPGCHAIYPSNIISVDVSIQDCVSPTAQNSLRVTCKVYCMKEICGYTIGTISNGNYFVYDPIIVTGEIYA